MVAGAEASAGRRVFDPGGLNVTKTFEDKTESPCTYHLLRVMHECVPRSKNKSVVVREAIVSSNDCLDETF